MDAFEIGNQSVGPDEPTFVIAEAGSNHNGDLQTAKELIDVAADAGADAVKFQTFRAEHLYVDDRDLVDRSENSAYGLLKRLEQPYEWIPELHRYCQSKGVYFMSSPFDEQSARKLVDYVPAFKIASPTLSHHPFLEFLADFGKPIIMSTGIHKHEEVKEAVEVLTTAGVSSIALLHCVSSYPTPLKNINLRTIKTLKHEFDTVVGLSDHTTNPIIAPSAAVALGASIVEKHVTLDNEMEGPDHSFALEPDELNQMITAIRNTEKALGEDKIEILDVEAGAASRSRRGVFAVRDIQSGEVIREDAIRILRPGKVDCNGPHPKYKSEIVGSTASEQIDEGEPVRLSKVDVQPK